MATTQTKTNGKKEMPPIKDIVEGADKVQLENAVNFDPRNATTVKALLDCVPAHLRGDLRFILPAQYWAKIEALGPQDIEGDPVEQCLNAAITCLIVNVVREYYPEAEDVLQQLKTHEHAERVWADVFGVIAKSRTTDGK